MEQATVEREALAIIESTSSSSSISESRKRSLSLFFQNHPNYAGALLNGFISKDQINELLIKLDHIQLNQGPISDIDADGVSSSEAGNKPNCPDTDAALILGELKDIDLADVLILVREDVSLILQLASARKAQATDLYRLTSEQLKVNKDYAFSIERAGDAVSEDSISDANFQGQVDSLKQCITYKTEIGRLIDKIVASVEDLELEQSKILEHIGRRSIILRRLYELSLSDQTGPDFMTKLQRDAVFIEIESLLVQQISNEVVEAVRAKEEKFADELRHESELMISSLNVTKDSFSPEIKLAENLLPGVAEAALFAKEKLSFKLEQALCQAVEEMRVTYFQLLRERAYSSSGSTKT